MTHAELPVFLSRLRKNELPLALSPDVDRWSRPRPTAAAPTTASASATDFLSRYTGSVRPRCATATLRATAERFGFAPNYLTSRLKRATGAGFREHR